MNTIDLIELGKSFIERYDKPTPLYKDEEHAIYWLGVPEDTAFRCNTYLIVDGHEGILVDPGGRNGFSFVKKRVAQIIPPESVTAMILCHQDPDVAGSMVEWLTLNPVMKVITSIRTNALISHYGNDQYTFFNINEESVFNFNSQRSLRFIESPFLHSPGAFVTHDNTSKFLFSGDIWAAIDMDWRLIVDDFHQHELKLNLFHLDYMSGNIAARGFLNRIRNLEIHAILPQHGSILPREMIPKALQYLENLKCGLDIIYPGLKVR